MKIIPVPGRLVRDPITGREVTEPTEVKEDAFWIRRIADGDVQVESEKPAKAAATTKGNE